MKNAEIRDNQLGALIFEELDFILTSASDPRLRELVVAGVEPGRGGRHFIRVASPGSDSFGLIGQLPSPIAFCQIKSVPLQLNNLSTHLVTQTIKN